MKKISFEKKETDGTYPKVEVGQYYKNKKTGDIYRVCSFYSDEDRVTRYALFNVAPMTVVYKYGGFGAWDSPTVNIDDIFENYRGNFELLGSGKIIIEI